MTSLYDFFDGGVTGPSTDQAYLRLGFPKNPFPRGSTAGGGEPFYRDHVAQQLTSLTNWVKSVHGKNQFGAASLVGNIGAGKTRILDQLSMGIRNWPAGEKAVVHSVHLSQAGYAKTSAGALLLGAFESAMDRIVDPSMPKRDNVSILPLVWAIVHSPKFPDEVEGLVARALKRAHEASSTKEKVQLCEDISLWLRRQPLTPTRVRASGLSRTIDWEGELIPILADLLRFGRACGSIRTLFFFIDQIEDLFTPSFTQIRRSRLLTDFRALVDCADKGAPIGMLFAWAPESDETLNKRYEALANRLRRIRIDLPLLRHEDSEPFAEVWIRALAKEPGFYSKKQPTVSAIANGAWQRLTNEKLLLGSPTTTPRELLRALADEVDALAGLGH